jgi:dTDP-4-amino-4,6-dideoxygalactose transaminase
MIPFNVPYLTGKERIHMEEAMARQKLSGNGDLTKRCHRLLEQRTGARRVLLTTSCTDALEMSALLARIGPGDEVIMPSFTFVSTANAFVLRGAKIVFVDSRPDHPGMDESAIAGLITQRTKAIVVMHYAGVACDMDPIMALAQAHGLMVIEDAAQAIDSFYKGHPLGGIGQLGTFSFHETKNIQCGEGGCLLINDTDHMARAEIIWEKGTNRAAFWRGEVDKYNWVDIGSSFLPSEITAAYLLAQLEEMDAIQAKRKALWQRYMDALEPAWHQGRVRPPHIPAYATNNGHMFHLVCENELTRAAIISGVRPQGIHTVFHYQSLHASPFYRNQHDGRELIHTDRYSETLLRLPLFHDLSFEQVDFIAHNVVRILRG